MKRWRRTWCILAPALLAACGTTATEGGMDSPVPAAKMHGIGREAAASEPDLARLVEQLDCDDVAVRSFAIQTLHRFTGETFGYRPEASPAARRPAVERWVRYVRDRGDASSTPTGAAHG